MKRISYQILTTLSLMGILTLASACGHALDEDQDTPTTTTRTLAMDTSDGPLPDPFDQPSAFQANIQNVHTSTPGVQPKPTWHALGAPVITMPTTIGQPGESTTQGRPIHQ